MLQTCTRWSSYSWTALVLTKTIQRKMCDFVTVEVKQGKLKGRKAVSKGGHPYFSFQGIPYAKPPVGPLRFASPQPPEPWSGIWEAQKEGPICSQYAWLMKRFRGCEDCLFLNVYTSELPDGDTSPCKAVMVWIHGGGFATGSGNTDLYGPDHLVDAGVIVVTLNYRLGPLGFLSLEDSVVPGNAGLKDQRAALCWVQQNIVQFGGDPNNVTIFGESAGGSSVQYHLLSPMSKGLFHKAIAQSGSVLNPWAMTTSLRSRSFKLGEILGCKTLDPKELLSFLRSVTAKELFDASAQTVTQEFHTDHGFAYGIQRGLKLQAKHSNCALYNYQFSFDGELGLFKKFIRATFLPGASHIDDLGYLFRVNMMDVNIDPLSPEMKTLTTMVKMWTNFAKTGNPTPELNSAVTVKWPQYSTANPEYLDINSDLCVGKDLLKERMAFWSEIYSSHHIE